MKYLFFTIMLTIPAILNSQNLTAEEIIRKSEENMRGGTSYAEMKMTIVRPTWTRETHMKSWAKDQDLALILVTAPARDQGIAYLKRNNDIWNWQPRIERTIKLPPSMMSQSWMGSEFTNDDLVRESSITDDYKQSLLGREMVGDIEAYKLELIPHEDAAVVWGKLIMWISVDHFMQVKTEFYDEDGFLINTMTASDFTTFDGRHIPARMTIVPEDKPGHKTIVEYVNLEFDIPIPDQVFTIQHMKNLP